MTWRLPLGEPQASMAISLSAVVNAAHGINRISGAGSAKAGIEAATGEPAARTIVKRTSKGNRMSSRHRIKPYACVGAAKRHFACGKRAAPK